MPKHSLRPPEWIDAAPIVVNEQIIVNATPQVVWPYIAAHAAWPSWFTQLSGVEPGADGVGGGRRVSAGKVTFDEEFTAWEPDRHFAFAVVESNLPVLAALAESVFLEPVGDDQTRVTYRQGVEGRRGFGWLMRLAWKGAARGLPGALSNLKERVESGVEPGMK